MADITLHRTHHLGLKGARVAADKMAEKLGKQFDLTGRWEGHTLHFDRPGVQGTLAISETTMHLEVVLGFLLKVMKGPIEKAVHDQLDKVLDAEAKPVPKAVPKSTGKPAPKATLKAAPKATPKAKAGVRKK